MDLYQSTHNSLVLVVLFEATVRFCFHVQLDLLRLVDSEPSELRAQDIWRSDLDDEKGQLEYILNGESPISRRERNALHLGMYLPLVRESRCRIQGNMQVGSVGRVASDLSPDPAKLRSWLGAGARPTLLQSGLELNSKVGGKG